MTLKQFRRRYPQGSLISEFVTIDRHQYIVRVLIQVAGTTLTSALGSADSVEAADDRARERALQLLELDEGGLPYSETTFVASPSTHQTPSALPLPTPSADQPITEPVAPSALQSPVTMPPPISDTVVHGIAPGHSPSPTTNGNTNVPDPNRVKETAETHEQSSVSSSPSMVATPTSAQTITSRRPDSAELAMATTPSTSIPVLPESEVVEAEPLDFSEIITKSDLELKRLGWTKEQGRDYLLQTYGKRSRHFLSDEELLEFLDYLKAQPSPT